MCKLKAFLGPVWGADICGARRANKADSQGQSGQNGFSKRQIRMRGAGRAGIAPPAGSRSILLRQHDRQSPRRLPGIGRVGTASLHCRIVAVDFPEDFHPVMLNRLKVMLATRVVAGIEVVKPLHFLLNLRLILLRQRFSNYKRALAQLSKFMEAEELRPGKAGTDSGL